MKHAAIPDLHILFGDAVQENVSLAPYTSARIGGKADLMVIVRNEVDLAQTVQSCWDHDLPFIIIGGGSNILVSDQGVREIVILNKAKATKFHPGPEPTVWAESGVIFSNLVHRTAAKGLAGIEWAATVPGTIGGAVYGNAGAFGGDTAHDLIRADVLSRDEGRSWWPAEKFGYGYRTSVLKRHEKEAVVLSAEFKLINGHREEIETKIVQFAEKRKETQPPGASMGSMFKNPEGDFAGRLIEAAGLKGTRIGNAQISPIHGNFFINIGETSAEDIRKLIDLVQKSVKDKFGVRLELEVELIGEWQP